MALILLVLLAAFLLAAALLIFKRSRNMRVESGMPQGEVVYDDSGVREELEKPLLSRRYGLVGRPDYLVRTRQNRESWVIPVEVKSTRAPERPYNSHVLQLAAYCLLVEDAYRLRPPYGLLRYADKTYKIPFTDPLRYRVLDTADAIRRARGASDIDRSHDDPARCAGCGYHNHCDQRLA